MLFEIVHTDVSLRFCDLRPGDQRPGDQRPGDQKPGDQRPGDQRPGDQRPVTGSVESNETVECEQRETMSATTQQDEEGTTSLPSKSKRQPIEVICTFSYFVISRHIVAMPHD